MTVPALSEHDIQSQIRIAISKYLHRICGFIPYWRINVGQGWIGNSKKYHQKQSVTVYPGDVVIREARVFDTGAPAGFSDLIGAVPVVITAEMVGKTIAIFSAVEVKTLTGKSSADQNNFISKMNSIGARVGVARSSDQALSILRGE